jgi:hypothetical protein
MGLGLGFVTYRVEILLLQILNYLICYMTWLMYMTLFMLPTAYPIFLFARK